MAISHVMKRTAGAVAALVLAVLVQEGPARANVVFDFNGVCATGCSGIATGVLTLVGSYKFGSDLTLPTFVSFHYSSSDMSFDVPSRDDLLGVAGGLKADGSIVGMSLVIVGENEFGVFPTGKFLVNITPTGADTGTTSAFTLVAVPEPSTWAMMLLALATLGYAGYRRARQAAAASRVRRREWSTHTFHRLAANLRDHTRLSASHA